MATPRRRPVRATSQKTNDVAPFADVDTAIPGELLITLAPDAADAMTASVPSLPARFASGADALGVSELDPVLADLGAHDIARIGLPSLSGADSLLTQESEESSAVLGRTFRVRIAAAADMDAAIDKIGKVASVDEVEPNRYRFASVVPNDSRYSEEWGMPAIKAPAAWDRTTGSSSVIVAVIDTGVDLTHPDLVGNLIPGFDMVDLGASPTPPDGWRFEGDFSGRDSSPADEVGHGTHVAGTIAAVSNNRQGVAGVAWQCRIMPIKAMTRVVRISDGFVSGAGSAADVAAAIRYAADNGASVINMSLGSEGSTSVEANAVAYAIGKGCVVVAAMGNKGTSNPSYPAALPDVISVGAVDSGEERGNFSQTGPHIDIMGPGVGILSTVLAGNYDFKTGTSMASPHVAGVAALIRSVKPSATVAEVADILRSTAKPLRDNASDPVPNDRYGWGLVDAAAAVAKAAPLPVKTTGCPPRTLPNCYVSLVVRCVPKTLPPACPVRTVPCVPRTLPPACPPLRTLACLPRTLDCGITITRTLTPIITRTRTIIAPIAAQVGAYDPYGYLAAQQEQDPEAVEANADADTGGELDAESAYALGYEAGQAAGYVAGVDAGYKAAVQEVSGEELPGTDASIADVSPAEHTLLPIQCPVTVLSPSCAWKLISLNRPVCFPVLKTIDFMTCNKTKLPIVCRGVEVPGTPWGTTFPTTTRFQALYGEMSTLYYGADWAEYGDDPYGESPFGG